MLTAIEEIHNRKLQENNVEYLNFRNEQKKLANQLILFLQLP